MRNFSSTEAEIMQAIIKKTTVSVKRHEWFVDTFSVVQIGEELHGEFGWLRAIDSLSRDSLITFVGVGDWAVVGVSNAGFVAWNEYQAIGLSRDPGQESIKTTAEWATKSSGEAEHFSTGARRDTQAEKTRWDLVPLGPLKRIANLSARGAEHYGENNYQLGIPVSRIYSSMLRHVNAYREGDRVEDHLAAVAWNAIAIMFMEEGVKAGRLPAELLDTGWEWQYPSSEIPTALLPSKRLQELAERLLAE